MNYYEETCKVLFQDGFHINENHGLWKLKKGLSQNEWDKVKQFFKFYHKNDKNLKNSKYAGWMTTQPVKVMLSLKTTEHISQQKLC